ncbi:hypothetical protein CGMCC3_g7178 [Colletotrichum fructicola]|nr:uncharacterized protein CGMCC3_g7178 [Colletotrichum fructicola]KAE9576836.1 hypothetical protein CGMCC3_g7178 [Colletotrichum fructicola]
MPSNSSDGGLEFPLAPESKSREGDLLGGHDVNRSSNDLRILFLELF